MVWNFAINMGKRSCTLHLGTVSIIETVNSIVIRSSFKPPMTESTDKIFCYLRCFCLDTNLCSVVFANVSHVTNSTGRLYQLFCFFFFLIKKHYQSKRVTLLRPSTNQPTHVKLIPIPLALVKVVYLDVLSIWDLILN